MDGVSPPHQRILSLAKGKGHVHDGHLTHRHVEEGEGETLQTGHQAWKKKSKTFTVRVPVSLKQINVLVCIGTGINTDPHYGRPPWIRIRMKMWLRI